MKVFVAGATGAIGRPLLRELVSDGHDVVAMTRTAARGEAVRALGAQPVIADALDRDGVIAAVREARPDAIIHQLTAIPKLGNPRRLDAAFAQTNRLRIAGTDNLLAAAEAAGTERFVAQSFGAFTYARTGTGLKTEENDLEPNPPKGQREVVAAVKYLENAVLTAPIAGAVLRYGGFYGPGTSIGGPDSDMIAAVRKRAMPIIGDGGGVWSFLHCEDAATATVAALDEWATGVFNVCDDDPAPVRDWLPALARAVGAQPPRHLPAWLGRLVVGEAGISVMTQVRGMSNAKARTVLGWKPRFASYREGFADGLQ